MHVPGHPLDGYALPAQSPYTWVSKSPTWTARATHAERQVKHHHMVVKVALIVALAAHREMRNRGAPPRAREDLPHLRTAYRPAHVRGHRGVVARPEPDTDALTRGARHGEPPTAARVERRAVRRGARGERDAAALVGVHRGVAVERRRGPAWGARAALALAGAWGAVWRTGCAPEHGPARRHRAVGRRVQRREVRGVVVDACKRARRESAVSDRRTAHGRCRWWRRKPEQRQIDAPSMMSSSP